MVLINKYIDIHWKDTCLFFSPLIIDHTCLNSRCPETVWSIILNIRLSSSPVLNPERLMIKIYIHNAHGQWLQQEDLSPQQRDPEPVPLPAHQNRPGKKSLASCIKVTKDGLKGLQSKSIFDVDDKKKKTTTFKEVWACVAGAFPSIGEIIIFAIILILCIYGFTLFVRTKFFSKVKHSEL